VGQRGRAARTERRTLVAKWGGEVELQGEAARTERRGEVARWSGEDGKANLGGKVGW
jgi:hypothetical protein